MMPVAERAEKLIKDLTEDPSLVERLELVGACHREWIRGHYHCRKCGGEIKCWKAFPFSAPEGVKRIGGCLTCAQLMVEFENAQPRWVELPL